MVIQRRADNIGDAVVLELVVPRSAKSVTVMADGIEILAAELGVARPAISDTGSARIPIGGRG